MSSRGTKDLRAIEVEIEDEVETEVEEEDEIAIEFNEIRKNDIEYVLHLMSIKYLNMQIFNI